MPDPISRKRRGWGGLWLAAGAIVTVTGALTAFVIADHLMARGAALVVVLGIVAVPLAAGVALESAMKRLGRTLRAERAALYLTPVLAVVVVALACTVMAPTAGAALRSTRARYPDAPAKVHAVAHRLGAVLDPAVAGAASPATPSTTLPLPQAATPAPSAEAAPEPHAPTQAPPARAYASGDASYREALDCTTLADVSNLADSHRPGGTRITAEALASARYPVGLPYLQAQDDKQLLAWFTGAPDSFAGVASRFEAAVHEGAHIWGVKRFALRKQTYPVRQDLLIEVARLSNFHRSEILSRHADAANDDYAKTYLEGASGAQGFNSLLDEYNAYAHSLAARVCTRDLLAPNTKTSARDGILTFMYYVETYLEIARTAHPADYAAIVADPGHRRLITTVWDRAEHWLRASANQTNLGVADERIASWVYEPARLAEIARLREAR